MAQFTNGSGAVEAGWSTSGFKVGDQITLAASTNGLPAGTYTLLPARYALLAGAYLVTPTKSSSTPQPGIGVAQPDGSSIVSGYRANANNPTAVQASAVTLYEVDSGAVVRQRAEYDNFTANTTLAAGATAADNAVPRLPIDAGELVITATAALTLNGSAMMNAPGGGLGGIVSIASPNNIVINDSGAGTVAGTLYLNASELSDFGAQSLLIGGFATSTTTGSLVTVATSSIELGNDAAHPLIGPDITLVSNGALVIDAGAVIQTQGILSGPATSFIIGSTNIAGSADGSLVRVSSDPNAQVSRNTAALTVGGGAASITVGAGSTISGGTNGAVTIDSTNLASFDPTANLNAASLSLGAGKISIELDNSGALQANPGLILPSDALAGLQGAGAALSLLSYSSIDIYGTGTIGSAGTASLALHAAGIRGFNHGAGTVTFAASALAIDNSPAGTAVAAVSGVDDTPTGTLIFDAQTFVVGANALNVVGYGNVAVNAARRRAGLGYRRVLNRRGSGHDDQPRNGDGRREPVDLGKRGADA